MNVLTETDVMFCMSRVPKDVVDLMKEYNLVLAGGFIRETISGGKVQDIDLFGESKHTLKVAALDLANKRKGRLHETDNAYTLIAPPRKPVQFITRWLCNGDPEEYVKLFDFTVCQAGIWFDGRNWVSCCHDNFYSDLAAKRLVYTFPDREEEAGGSLLRVRKFLERGYHVQIACLAGVMARIFMEVRNRSGMTQNERDLAAVLVGIMREVDPLSVVDGVEVPEATIVTD